KIDTLFHTIISYYSENCNSRDNFYLIFFRNAFFLTDSPLQIRMKKSRISAQNVDKNVSR
ncbi:MAG: hypothetical protein K2N49_05605, partial [Ruminococcus sp.]|nr:hypothetical protein [Ruminococcus sp.]